MVFMYLNYCLIEPILSLRLEDYNVRHSLEGLIYAIGSVAYIFSTMIVTYIIPEWVEHRVTLLTSLFLVAASTLLVGPVYPDKNIWMMVSGLFLTGFF